MELNKYFFLVYPAVLSGYHVDEGGHSPTSYNDLLTHAVLRWDHASSVRRALNLLDAAHRPRGGGSLVLPCPGSRWRCSPSILQCLIFILIGWLRLPVIGMGCKGARPRIFFAHCERLHVCHSAIGNSSSHPGYHGIFASCCFGGSWAGLQQWHSAMNCKSTLSCTASILYEWSIISSVSGWGFLKSISTFIARRLTVLRCSYFKVDSWSSHVR